MKYSNKDSDHFFKLGKLDIGNNHTVKQFLRSIPLETFDKITSIAYRIDLSEMSIIEFKDKFDTPYCYYLPISDLCDYLKAIDKEIDAQWNELRSYQK